MNRERRLRSRIHRLILRSETKSRVSRDAPAGGAPIGAYWRASFEAASRRLEARRRWDEMRRTSESGRSLLPPRHPERKHQADERVGDPVEREAFMHRTRRPRRTMSVRQDLVSRTACPRRSGLRRLCPHPRASSAQDASACDAKERTAANGACQNAHSDRTRARATAAALAVGRRHRGSSPRRGSRRVTRSIGRTPARLAQPRRSGRGSLTPATEAPARPFRP